MCNCGHDPHCTGWCSEKTKPHKWTKEIKAWADGAEIESRTQENMVWRLNQCPLWQIEYEYRIKPPQETYAGISKAAWFSHHNKALGSSAWNAGAQAVIVEFCRRNGLIRADYPN